MRLLQLLLGAVLFSVGVLKLVDGFHDNYALPRVFYFTIAISECILGAVVLTRRARLASFCACLLFVGGVVFSFFTGSAACGCFGGLSLLLRKYEMVVAGAIGLLSTVVFYLSSRGQYVKRTIQIESRQI
jgi:hypothetical protein